MYLWGTIISFEYTLWIGCAALYLFDHARLLSPQELLYEEMLTGRWRIRVNKISFTLFNKELYILNPFLPWLCVFRAMWGQDFSPSAKVARMERQNFLACLRGCSELRLVSLFSFIAIFIIGPLLTATKGLPYAVLAILMLNVRFQVLSVSILWFRHKALRVSRWTSMLLVFEGLVCPPYTACLLKRVSLNYMITCDGLVLAKALHRSRNFPAAREHIASRIREQLQVEAFSAGQEKSVSRYIKKLRSS